MAPESQERLPYVGPRPFERQDRDLFFGRERETSDVVSLVTAHRVLLLYAQSGAGKTSLINAGLVPLLEEEGFEVLPLARVQGLIPEDIQPEEIPNLYAFNALMNWAEDEADPKWLSQMSLAGFLKEREHPTDEEGLPSPRIVIFDQFEELFTFYQERWQDREGVFEQVHDALEGDPLLRVVFVMREDYIAQLDPYIPLLPEKLRTRFRLERLGKEAALSAVTGPLRDTERSFAEGMAEQLVEELLKVRVETAAGKTEVATGEFVEPVQLQVVCQSLWQDLPPDVTVITQDHLQAFGDVDQALSEFYERCIERAAQKPGVKEADLRSWFEQSLITPAGTRGIVYRGWKETSGILNTAVEVLESLHLIRGEWRSGARWYELIHDRFIEPIQESNKMWREKRRRSSFTALGAASVAALVVVLVLVFATARAIQNKQALEQVDMLATRGQFYDDLGQYQQALDYYQQALAIAREISDRATEKATLSNIGRVYYKLGQCEQALDYYQQALAIAQEIGDRAMEKATLSNIGGIYEKLGQYQQALDYYKQALAIAREIGDRAGEGTTLNNIGVIYEKLGQYQQALDYYRQALAIAREIGDRAREGTTLNNIGKAYYNLEQYEQALAYYQQTLAIRQEIGDQAGEGTTLNNIGVIYEKLGQYEQALDYYKQALAIRQEIGNQAVEAWHSLDKRLDFTKILPETKRPQEVQLLDADGDGKDEWIVFYKFDLVEDATGRKFSPIGAAVYNDDHGDPPVIFPYELHPPDRVYLGEQNCVAEVRDLITTNQGPELLVSNFAEEGLVVDLSVFHWYDHDKNDLSKNPGEGRQGYECLGFFHGSGGIMLSDSRVIVKERAQERSQLSIKNVYAIRENSYFQPGGRELWAPVEKSVEFTFGVPEDVAQSPYPEKVVLAFYVALGQNTPLAQTYLSEASGLKNVVGAHSFGTAAGGDRIKRVLVKRIIYTPDMEKEERHEPVRVTVSVASVTNEGEDLPRDVTWELVWELPREGVAQPGWKLHRMITPTS